MTQKAEDFQGYICLHILNVPVVYSSHVIQIIICVMYLLIILFREDHKNLPEFCNPITANGKRN